LVNFLQPVTSFGFQSGDFGGDEDTISLSIFSGPNATGTVLGTTSVTYPATSAFPHDVVSLSLSGVDIRSATMIGGSSISPNSVYFDNLSATFGATAVPEPASLALFGTALAGFGLIAAAAARTCKEDRQDGTPPRRAGLLECEVRVSRTNIEQSVATIAVSDRWPLQRATIPGPGMVAF